MNALNLTDLSPVLKTELARRNLLDYCNLVDPGYQTPPHIRLLAEHLESLERGEITRLCVSMPPRHGKSRLVSQLFASWYLGRHPAEDIILAGYGSELSERNSRIVRDLVLDERNPFDVAVRSDSRAVDRWHTTAGGQVIAVGVGSGLTGHGGSLVVADDLVRDRSDADSEAVRKSTAEWFADVLRTRLAPGGKIVLLGTRWHWNDILGTTLASSNGEWRILNLPAVCEDESDPLGRELGEALWPSRFPVESLPRVPSEMSSRSFAALYQGRPTPEAGGLFKRAWFQRTFDGPRPKIVDQIRRGLPPIEQIIERPRQFQVIGAIDCASKVSVSADFSVIAIVATDGIDFYVLDIIRKRVEFADLIRMTLDAFRKWEPSRVYIEDTSNGIPLIQELRRSTNMPVIPISVKGSKVARAEATTQWFESERVVFPKGAPWLNDLVDECVSFPLGAHDDQVDALTMALRLSQVLIEQNSHSMHGVMYLGAFMAR
jgi:predicted phage terminase large subunit-like protein